MVHSRYINTFGNKKSILMIVYLSSQKFVQQKDKITKNLHILHSDNLTKRMINLVEFAEDSLTTNNCMKVNIGANMRMDLEDLFVLMRAIILETSRMDSCMVMECLLKVMALYMREYLRNIDMLVQLILYKINNDESIFIIVK